MESSHYKYTNHLIRESSPYLLQHAHNPVDWYPWGEEALTKAKAENKLVIVSIGYAACHWCHVMEHESFEDEQVALFMNDHFVSIKVDREERPDIDLIYMNAIQLITRQGGWPLNCVTFPDGRPIYGGTYFPKGQWMDLLSAVLNFVSKNRPKAENQATYLVQGIQSSELVFSDMKEPDHSVRDLNVIFNSWKSNIDFIHGGIVGAPKFPMPSGNQFLLHYYYLLRKDEALNAVTATLDHMADGGIYDQVGGGFGRYSTDAYWKVPHFEKMLYDNAQLVSLYSTAFQITKNQRYRTIVHETLKFISRELTSPQGAFYSSLDADSEGIEGKFYSWTAREVEEVLGEKASLIMDYFSVSWEGNWENGLNILYRTINDEEIASKYGITADRLREEVSDAKEKLLNRRLERVRPGVDDKILTSWNALMIRGCVDAYRTFGAETFLEMAVKNAEFIYQEMKSGNNTLKRNYKNGIASVNAFLDDYAFVISAFISVYQAVFEEVWLLRAMNLLNYAIDHFYDKSTGMFYYTSDIDPPLIARKMEISDNVIPSSNSEMAKNLFVLGHYYSNEEYIQKAVKMLNRVKPNLQEGSVYYSNWDILLAWCVSEPFEVVIAGEDYKNMREKFEHQYLPDVLFSGGDKEGSLPLLQGKFKQGQTIIYVCRNKTCKLPVFSAEDALKQLTH
jgi:uncharacterized protein YyaL (SSP411 family)